MSPQINANAIIDEWTIMIQGAGDSSEKVLNEIEDRLADSAITGLAIERMSDEDAARSRLVIHLNRLPEVCQYLEARAYGRHLQVRHVVFVKPGFRRDAWHALWGRDATAWYRARHGANDELKSFLALFHHVVVEAAHELANRCADGSRRGLDEILEAWQ